MPEINETLDAINPPKCSFCRKRHDQIKKLIAGPDGVYICNECVYLCQEILDSELDRTR